MREIVHVQAGQCGNQVGFGFLLVRIRVLRRFSFDENKLHPVSEPVNGWSGNTRAKAKFLMCTLGGRLVRTWVPRFRVLGRMVGRLCWHCCSSGMCDR